MSEQSHQVQATKIEPGNAVVPRSGDFREDVSVVEKQRFLTNAQLQKLAAEHHPPAEWFAGDEEDIF